MALRNPGKFIRTSLMGAAAAFALVAGVQSSSAGSYWHGHGGSVAAAGIIGFAAGAVLGSALSGPRYYGGGYGYYRPRAYYAPRVYYAPRRHYAPQRYYAPRYPDRSYGYVNRSSGTVITPHVPAPVYNRAPVRYRPAQWTPEWIAYCSRKYRSFNPRTGTYTAYSGRVRQCR